MALLTFSFLLDQCFSVKQSHCWHGTVNLEDENGEGSAALTLHGTFRFRHHMIMFCLYNSFHF